MHENNKRLVTVSEIAKYCNVSRSSIIQRIKSLRQHRKTIDNFLYSKHRKNHKLYFDKFIANLIENSFRYKKDKSSNDRNLLKFTKIQNERIKDLKSENIFLRNELTYMIRYGKN